MEDQTRTAPPRQICPSQFDPTMARVACDRHRFASQRPHLHGTRSEARDSGPHETATGGGGALLLGGAETTIGIDEDWQRVSHGKCSSYRLRPHPSSGE